MGLTKRLSRFFHPQKSNKYRSQLLHPETLMILSIVVVAVFALFNAVRFFPSLADRVLGYASNINADQVLIKTNEERAARDLKPLQINEKLNQAALAKAQDMFADQYWSHNSPDGDQPWDFIKDSGYVYKYAGENLARDFDNTREMIAAWMASPTHKENIVNPNFTQMGLAVLNGNLKVLIPPSSAGVCHSRSSEDRSSGGRRGNDTASMAETPLDSLINQEDRAGEIKGENEARGLAVFSPLYLTKTFFLMVIFLIILTLVYDSFISTNRRYDRIAGQNFAQIMLFMSVAFLLILFPRRNGYSLKL